ncbi:MAG: protein kinase [Deltaproteobacteria bacterium]|nr:protein kinase [Deltaproteobacteria bacterium]
MTAPGLLPTKPLAQQAPVSRPPSVPSRPPDRPASSPSGRARPMSEPDPGTRADRDSGSRPVKRGGQIAPGTVLAGRYRIERFIAKGGMGEVYEALDQELRERVALKMLLPDVARDAQMLERFRREIQLARRVTHPNVCRVFDVARHDGGAGPVVFLTMELLQGETLSQRVRRDGPLGTAEALRIIDEVVDALEAAHRAGVIHRDFKSANVMLVPTPDGRRRAVVTDFGLAQGHGEAREALTQNVAVGTPGYMAPEQVRGEDPTPAMDIYALGVVMYDMLCGQRPFAHDNAFIEATARMSGEPTPPSRRRPGVDPAWDGVILRCMALLPEERFAAVRDVVDALQPLRDAAAAQAPAPPAPTPAALPWRRWARPAAALLVAGLLGGLGWRALSSRWGAAPQDRVRRVAVLGFRNLAAQPETAWLGVALGEMMSTELAAAKRLRVVSQEDVARMRIELGLSGDQPPTRESLQRVRRNVGAELVVTGGYLLLAGKEGERRVRVDARLLDSTSGDELAAVADTGVESELFSVVERVGLALRVPVEGGGARPGAPALVSALPNARAAPWYAQGLERLRQFDALGATQLLQKAVEADPDSPRVRWQLANAWSALGYDELARGEALRALERASALPPGERKALEARVRALNQQWDDAVRLYGELSRETPDDLDRRLRLADAQLSAGRPADSLATLEELRKLEDAEQDPRVDLAEAFAAAETGDFRRQLAAASRAEKKAAEAGARLQAAQARHLVASAKGRLGEPDEALRIAEEARVVLQEAGDSRAAAEVINVAANVLLTQGRLQEARTKYESALGVLEAIGNKRGQAMVVNNIGLVLGQQGNHREAARMAERALKIGQDLNDNAVMTVALNAAANSLQALGDLPRARQNYERALQLDRQAGNRFGVAVDIMNIAAVQVALGDLAGALKGFAEAGAIFDEAGNRSFAAYARAARGDILGLQGRWDDARRELAAVMQTRTELKEKGPLAQLRVSMGQVELWSGQADRALVLFTDALETFQEEGMLEDQALAQAYVAETLAARGAPAEARKAADAALALCAKGVQNPSTRMSVDLADARVKAAQGKLTEARRTAERVAAQAKDRNNVLTALDARLALLDIDARKGKPGAAQAKVRAYQDEVRRLGIGSLAERAGRIR